MESNLYSSSILQWTACHAVCTSHKLIGLVTGNSFTQCNTPDLLSPIQSIFEIRIKHQINLVNLPFSLYSFFFYNFYICEKANTPPIWACAVQKKKVFKKNVTRFFNCVCVLFQQTIIHWTPSLCMQLFKIVRFSLSWRKISQIFVLNFFF